MHNSIRFILAGQVKEIANCDPTKTVLEFLRDDLGLTGTKEGCAEGDCGACTVVVGELLDNELCYRSYNSCIQFLAGLDGKQLLTVEDLSTESEPVHSVQKAMVDEHGSQCGFCTPGFVMSLFALYHNHPDRDLSRKEIELGLAGNLCRCTGYAPIIRAAEKTLKAWREDGFTANRDQTIKLLKSIQPAESLETVNDKRRFLAPRTCNELGILLEKHPGAVLVAGATDVGLWVTKQQLQPDTVIHIGAISELKQIETHDEYLGIGATVTYTDAIEPISTLYPAFRSLIERIGAMQVRNAGTIGGNIANGSPIGDMPPGLIAAGARLLLRSKHGQRIIDLEDFFVSYGKQDLQAGEFVEQIRLPIPTEERIFSTYKISKRAEQDISAVCGAFSLNIENGVIHDARVCFGGMAETPKRATRCEEALEGKPWAQETIHEAMQAMDGDYTPISDMRASADYRMRVAQNLLLRFYLEHSDTGYPVRLSPRFDQMTIDGDKADGK